MSSGRTASIRAARARQTAGELEDWACVAALLRRLLLQLGCTPLPQLSKAAPVMLASGIPATFLSMPMRAGRVPARARRRDWGRGAITTEAAAASRRGRCRVLLSMRGSAAMSCLSACGWLCAGVLGGAVRRLLFVYWAEADRQPTGGDRSNARGRSPTASGALRPAAAAQAASQSHQCLRHSLALPGAPETAAAGATARAPARNTARAASAVPAALLALFHPSQVAQ